MKKIKKTIYSLGAIVVFASTTSAIVACDCTVAINSKVKEQIDQGTQFLKDYYNYSEEASYANIATTIGYQIDKTIGIRTFSDVSVQPKKFLNDVETYSVNATTIPYLTQPKKITFNVNYNINTQFISYPDFGDSLVLDNIGSPFTSGSDVNLIHYLQTNILSFVKKINNTENLDPEIVPSKKTPLPSDSTLNGFEVIFENKDIIFSNVKITYNSQNGNHLGYKIASQFIKETGKTYFTEIFPVKSK